MGTLPPDAARRLDTLPCVRRARGAYLYTADGRRLIDLYRDGGRSILGHRLASVDLTIKNQLSVGLGLSAPSIYARHLDRAAHQWFPDHPHVRVYPSEEAALQAISEGGGSTAMYDPARVWLDEEPIAATSAILKWRPFLALNVLQYTTIMPVLPLPAALPWQLVVSRQPLPPTPPVPALLLRALVRAITELDRSAEPPRISLPGFLRIGPYACVPSSPQEYDRVFAEFLRRDILISPLHPGPTAAPFEISAGERRRVAQTCRELLLGGR